MTGKELIRLLEKNDWKVVDIHGSHYKLKNSDGTAIVVPVHGAKDLKTGTLNAILKQTGLK